MLEGEQIVVEEKPAVEGKLDENMTRGLFLGLITFVPEGSGRSFDKASRTERFQLGNSILRPQASTASEQGHGRTRRRKSSPTTLPLSTSSSKGTMG